MSCTISSGLIRSISLVAGFTFSVSSTLKTCVEAAFAFALSSILPTPLNQYCAPPRFQDDPRAHPIRINIPTSVGARVADEGLGGPLWSPASCSPRSNLAGTRSPPTPTDQPTPCLASQLRLMPIGRPCGRPDPMQMDAQSYRVRAGLAPALACRSAHAA